MSNWLPLENNPVLLNNYIGKLGVDTEKVEFNDILGFDDELLSMVPQPVLAVLLLFPITRENEEIKQNEDETESKIHKDLWFIRQTIGNACGTIGILHAVANNLDHIPMKDEAWLTTYLKDAKDKSPEERASLLEGDDEITEKHDENAQESTLESNEQTDVHFVAFVQKDGEIYEMDGRRTKPQYRGDTTQDNFLSDVAQICRARMQLNPNDWTKFSAIALCKK